MLHFGMLMTSVARVAFITAEDLWAVDSNRTHIKNSLEAVSSRLFYSITQHFSYDKKTSPDSINFWNSIKYCNDCGFSNESELTAWVTGIPIRIFLMGTSIFLPFNVLGSSLTLKISFGTCLGEHLANCFVNMRFQFLWKWDTLFYNDK